MNYHVFHPDRVRAEEFTVFEFSGNKPSLPPLTTEAVESIVYVEEDDEPNF